MIADWSVEAVAGSAAVVIPWEGWVDLRKTAPGELSEVRSFPELNTLLHAANRVPLVSSKVDVFPVTSDDADPDLVEEHSAAVLSHGLGSYLDVTLAEADLPFEQAERVARETVAALRVHSLRSPVAVEIVVRPARVWGRESWAWTLFTLGFGADPEGAREAWTAAAEETLAALRLAVGMQSW